MTRPFDVLIFDWDGTLMDSEAHIVACLAQALRAVGLPPAPPGELRQVIGLGLREALAALMPGQPAARIDAAVAAYRREFLAPRPSPSRLFPGVRDTLQALRAAGYRLAVATGKSRRGLDKVLAETGLAPLFAATRCADETASKPHPRMLVEILAELDGEPGRALMIGDTEFDLQMAARIGMPRLAVDYGVHEVARLRRHAPLAILSDLRDLPGWLAARADLPLAAEG